MKEVCKNESYTVRHHASSGVPGIGLGAKPHKTRLATQPWDSGLE